jgi:hypothetical protein
MAHPLSLPTPEANTLSVVTRTLIMLTGTNGLRGGFIDAPRHQGKTDTCLMLALAAACANIEVNYICADDYETSSGGRHLTNTRYLEQRVAAIADTMEKKEAAASYIHFYRASDVEVLVLCRAAILVLPAWIIVDEAPRMSRDCLRMFARAVDARDTVIGIGTGDNTIPELTTAHPEAWMRGKCINVPPLYDAKSPV